MESKLELKLSAQQVEDLIQLGFAAKRKFLVVEEARPGYVRVRIPYRESMLRPGGVLSGPALFAAADTGMYALVLSHVGPELMAVTANFNMNFLNKARPGDVIAECRMLKLGRRLAVMEAALYSSAEPGVLVAQVSGSYALPPKVQS
jgi:uncharacterized protein (TIGR00369 family)